LNPKDNGEFGEIKYQVCVNRYPLAATLSFINAQYARPLIIYEVNKKNSEEKTPSLLSMVNH
jgi:hypothetical protein